MTRKFALAALLATAVAVPALAQAQPEGPGEPRERHIREERAPQIETARADRGSGEWQGRRGGQVGAAQPQPSAPVAQPRPQPVPQPGGWRGNNGGNADAGGWRARGNWGGNATATPGQPRWNRNDAPTAQIGGTPAAPPAATAESRRWDNGRVGGTVNGTQRTPGDWNRDGRQDNWRSPGEARRDAPRTNGDRNWQGNNGWNGGNRVEGNRGGDNRQWNYGNRGGDNRWNNGQANNRDWNNSRSWNREWRRDDRYDWQRYRYSNRNLYRAQPYYAPYGWSYGYRRFSIGLYLSNVLFDQQYWIDDPYDYRLPPAYGPYRWVRYYDDVMLVDLRSGQVVDVIYDFFW